MSSARLVVLNATAYDEGPSGARTRAVVHAAGLLLSGAHVTVLTRRGSAVGEDVVNELGPRAGDVASRLDVRPLGNRRAGRRTLQRALPPGSDLFVTDYHPVLRDVRTALTVHDLRGFEGQGESLRRTLGHRALLPRNVSAAHAVVVPTRAMGEAVVGRFGADPARVHVVPNVVASAWRGASPWRAGDTLLWIGGTSVRKGFSFLCEVLSRMSPQPDRVLLEVVGRDGEQARRIAAESGLAPRNVRAHGALPTCEVVELALRCAAVVHPSRYEGFGLVPAECTAAGVPVIAADCAAVREVTGGELELLPAGDARAWNRAVVAALRGELSPPSGRAVDHVLTMDARSAGSALLALRSG